MGGKAFANRKPPLPTPRMAPPVYFAVRDSIMQSLSVLFVHVTSPVPFPQKPSYGDIDVLVCEPLPPYTLLAKSLASTSAPHTSVHGTQPPTAITPAFLQEYLHAVACINNSAQSKTFAIPHPELPGIYIQVDVTILPSLEALTWYCTLHSYGALFTLIGAIMCKPKGLTLNDKGLHLRIPEIEKEDRKRASVLLTADWDTVMDTIGLDMLSFKRGFAEASDLWAWIAGAKFFDREDVGYKERNSKKRKSGNGEMWEKFENWLVERDRQLGINRIEDRGDGIEDKRTALREERRGKIFEAMVEKFYVGTEIDERLAEWRVEKRELEDKKTRKEARRKIIEEDDSYANAWLVWMKE